MSPISFVYFDVGGVAVRDYSDSDKWIKMMDDMGVAPDRREEFDAIYERYDDQICTGLPIDSLIPEFSQKLNLKLPANFSMNKYFVTHFERNHELIDIMEEIKKSTKIGLLTDIYPGMLDLIFAADLIPQEILDVIVDSSIEHVRKPMPEIYELATKRAGVPPAEILFIDNRQKNLDGAEKAGWQTYLYDSRDYRKSNIELSSYLRRTLQGFSL